MANEQNLKPFVKGDARINRKGRPKSFDALRALAQQIAHETVPGKDGAPLVIEGHVVTVAEAILRGWASSKNQKMQQSFIEVAFGKTPERTNITAANIDLSKLSDEQIRRIADGEDILSVIATAGKG